MAAATAMNLDPKDRVSAFLIGIGIALDHSSLLRDNPLTGKIAKAAESDTERRLRLSVLGSPTIAGRRDSCQHFAVSLALTDVVGPTITRTAGFAKEAKDMTTTSGFSFADIAADLAGIRFAEKVKNEPMLLSSFAKQFQIEGYVPSMKDLPEGMDRDTFNAKFGSTRDARFTNQVNAIEKTIEALPNYK